MSLASPIFRQFTLFISFSLVLYLKQLLLLSSLTSFLLSHSYFFPILSDPSFLPCIPPLLHFPFFPLIHSLILLYLSDVLHLFPGPLPEHRPSSPFSCPSAPFPYTPSLPITLSRYYIFHLVSPLPSHFSLLLYPPLPSPLPLCFLSTFHPNSSSLLSSSPPPPPLFLLHLLLLLFMQQAE